MAKRPFTDLPVAINNLSAVVEGGILPKIFGDGITYEVVPAQEGNWEVHRVRVDLTVWERPVNDQMVALSLFPLEGNEPLVAYKIVRLRKPQSRSGAFVHEPGILVIETRTTLGSKAVRVTALNHLVHNRTENSRNKRRKARLDRRERSYRRGHGYALA